MLLSTESHDRRQSFLRKASLTSKRRGLTGGGDDSTACQFMGIALNRQARHAACANASLKDRERGEDDAVVSWPELQGEFECSDNPRRVLRSVDHCTGPTGTGQLIVC